MSLMNFVEQLDRQLRFIETSVREFDQDNKYEGIRIATCLRVIFHQTNSSTSLLNHLGSPYARIRTSVSKPPYDQDWLSPLAAIEGGFRAGWTCTIDPSHSVPRSIGVPNYIPFLDKVPFKRYTQAPDWFSKEPALILQTKKVTRKDIVLWAANKDGGAHVDRSLPSDYVYMNRAISYTMEFNYNNGEDFKIELTPEGAHLALLRQMAWELLSSPEILKLAGRQS